MEGWNGLEDTLSLRCSKPNCTAIAHKHGILQCDVTCVGGQLRVVSWLQSDGEITTPHHSLPLSHNQPRLYPISCPLQWLCTLSCTLPLSSRSCIKPFALRFRRVQCSVTNANTCLSCCIADHRAVPATGANFPVNTCGTSPIYSPSEQVGGE